MSFWQVLKSYLIVSAVGIVVAALVFAYGEAAL